MSVEDPAQLVEAYLGFVERVDAELARVRAAQYTGTDSDGLATAEVDGDGRVVAVRLSRVAARVPTRALGPAVRAAFADAERQRQAALAALATRIQPPEGVNGHSGG